VLEEEAWQLVPVLLHSPSIDSPIISNRNSERGTDGFEKCGPSFLQENKAMDQLTLGTKVDNNWPIVGKSIVAPFKERKIHIWWSKILQCFTQ